MRIRNHHWAGFLAASRFFAAALVAIALLVAPQARAASTQPVPDTAAPQTRAVADLSTIRFRRKFRVLVVRPDTSPDRLMTPDATSDVTRLIEQFADEEFLLPEWVVVDRWEDLVPALLEGRGDLIGTPMKIHEFQDRSTEFSVPVGHIREILIGRAAERISHPRDLSGREIALRARSTFWPTLHALQREVPNIRSRVISDGLGHEQILQGVQTARYDLAVVDPGPVELGQSRWQGLRAIEGISSSGNLSLGIHPQATELKEVLDTFLTREQLARREFPRRSKDLDGIKRSGVLRVLTRNNAASYFIWRGRPLGFEYELISKFAKEQKLSVEMIVAESRDQLLPGLLRGEGDMVAAGLAVTPERREGGVTFTRPYKESYDVLVTRADDDSLLGPSDLAGRTVTVRESSTAWKLLQDLVAQGLDVTVEAAPEDLETEEIIERVASGLYDVTVADAYSVKVAITWRDDVRTAFALDGPMPIAWALRESNVKLHQALNEFLDREYKQVFYNIVHARYFENPRTIRSHIKHRADSGIVGAGLSPYDDIVRQYAEKHGFDWPLIVALMYRESRFDPKVVSWAGAKGLMQMLPVTAKRFGATNLDDPETAIKAGIRMLHWLYQQMEPELTVKDRTWFSLAAYNAGLGHLLDARRLAKKLGLDPNQWFDNVEKAMLLLSKPTYYRKARHGYVRGIEPVTFVRDIRSLYNAYRATLPL